MYLSATIGKWKKRTRTDLDSDMDSDADIDSDSDADLDIKRKGSSPDYVQGLCLCWGLYIIELQRKTLAQS